MSKEKKDKKKKEKPLSLAGPDFKELMAAFLKVDPKEKSKEKKEGGKDE